MTAGGSVENLDRASRLPQEDLGTTTAFKSAVKGIYARPNVDLPGAEVVRVGSEPATSTLARARVQQIGAALRPIRMHQIDTLFKVDPIVKTIFCPQ
jgi:hypothetical protein